MESPRLTPSMKKAISNSTWPYDGRGFIHPKDLPPQNGFRILSKLEKHHMTTEQLETYKSACCLAEMNAPTELEKENLHNEANRVNSQINERKMGVRY